ncbi:MAG: HlyD family type I secretion periplasmic adaptor subunit [Pseudomonadota bacterium]
MSNGLLEKFYADGLQRLSRLTVVMLVALFGGGILWAASAAIEGAVIASGQVMVESNAKTIEHSEGGYVSEIRVREGDAVEAGQILIKLDETRAAAELAIITESLNEIIATETRLLAENAGLERFSITETDMAFVSPNEKFENVLVTQQRLLEARRASIEGQIRQLSEQIAQNEQQIVGLEAQLSATTVELDLIDAELKDVERLLRQGLVTEIRANELRRDKANVDGRRGVLIADIARARLSISEREVQKIRVRDDARTQRLQQLQDVRIQKTQLVQQKITAQDRLSRLEIRTAQAGIVHDLQIHTVDGVIQPGETLMSIVPNEDLMVIEARVATTDIDQVHQGQDAMLMFSSFNMRTTPQLHGTVTRVSPDVSIDEVTGVPFYKARLAVKDGEMERLGEENQIMPGMPVDTFIRTRERTVANYLIQPFVDHMHRAFREE